MRGAISSRIGLARLHTDRAEPEAAGTFLDEAASLATQYQDRERSAEIDSLYARYYLLRGDKSAAAQFAARAKDVFERLGMQHHLAVMRSFIANLNPENQSQPNLINSSKLS